MSQTIGQLLFLILDVTLVITKMGSKSCLAVSMVFAKVYFMEVLQVIIGFVSALIEKARKSPFVIVPHEFLFERLFVCKFTDQFSVLICHCQMVVDCELTQFFLVFIFFLCHIDCVLD